MKKKLIAIILSMCVIGVIGGSIALSSKLQDSTGVSEETKSVKEKLSENDEADDTETATNESLIVEAPTNNESTTNETTTNEVTENDVTNENEVALHSVEEVVEEEIANVFETPNINDESQNPEVNAPITMPQSPSYDSNFMAEVESMIFTKLNEERSKNGLAQLSYNGTMERYARIKSQDMGDRGYFDHNNPEGELITAQMQRDGVGYNSWGENIAYIGGVSDATTLANQFMTNWMNSAGHRANILSSNFSSIGVGVYKIGNTVYATQEFYN